MSGVMDAVLGALDARTIGAMAQQLGTSPQQTERAIHAALPLLVGQMARNTQQPGGSEALHRALQRDHAGVDLGGVLGGVLGALGGGGRSDAGAGLGDLLGGVLGAMGGGRAPQPRRGDMMSEGMAILGHVFGQRQLRVAGGVGQVSGLGGEQSSQLLAMLAPIVMTVLARLVQNQGGSADALGGLLGGEARRVQQAPGAGGMVNALLDRDGDGDVDLADLMQSGDLLGGLFGRR